MGLNILGFAISYNVDNFKEISDKLNIVIEGPIEETIFEVSVSNNSSNGEIFYTNTRNGAIIIVDIDFPIFEEGFSVLSKNGQKITKFMYGETSGEYYFEFFENGELLRKRYVSENIIKLDYGKKKSIEYAGLSDDELLMEFIKETCGEEVFTIEPDVKTVKYKYISGKPLPIVNPKRNESVVTEKRTVNILGKNRLVFFLIIVHLLLGISNLATSNQLYNKSFSIQIISYFSLLVYGVMGYFLLLRKNWMRIIFIIFYFVSLPFSLLVFKPNTLFLNNLFQLVIDTYILVLMFSKGIKSLYIEDKAYLNESPFSKITLKEILMLLSAVVFIQFGAADIFTTLGLMDTGFISGLVSGSLMVIGIYMTIFVLKKNYYR